MLLPDRHSVFPADETIICFGLRRPMIASSRNVAMSFKIKRLARSGALDALRKLGKKGRVTLLYAAHDPYVNHAVVLKSVLQGRLPRGEAGIPRSRR